MHLIYKNEEADEQKKENYLLNKIMGLLFPVLVLIHVDFLMFFFSFSLLAIALTLQLFTLVHRFIMFFMVFHYHQIQ